MDRTKLLKTLIECLKPALREHKYSYAGSNWFQKQLDDVICFVHIQGYLRADNELRVTVNLYAGSKKLQSMFPKVFPFLEPGACPIECRVSELLTPREDKWWSVSTEERAKATCGEIIAALEDFGLPFLDGIKSLSDMVPYLRKGICTSFALDRSTYLADAIEGKADPSNNPWKDL